MAEMKISNTLVNDTSTGVISYAEQLKDRLIDWTNSALEYNGSYPNPDYDPDDPDSPETIPYIPDSFKTEGNKFQDKLNTFFLDHWAEYQRFLHEEGVDPQTIDSWKEVQDFLAGLPDDETMWLKNQLTRLDNRITAMDIPDGGAYDISADHVDGGGNYAEYASLDAAIAAIPEEKKKGGMSIRYIQSSDNKYVSFRYLLSSTAAEDFTNTGNWINVDDEIATDGIEIQALAKLLVQQQYEIEGLKKMVEGNLGDIRATTINTDDMPMVSGKPLVIVENGAPTEVPYFIGQIHVNRSTSPVTIKVCYQVTGSINDWK